MALGAADFFEFVLQRQLVQRAQRKRREDRDTLMQHAISILERKRDFGFSPLSLRRIGNAPMRRHWLTRPHRAGFASRVVANSESKIERRRAGLCEFMPRL